MYFLRLSEYKTDKCTVFSRCWNDNANELRGKQVKDLHGPATVIEEFRAKAYAAHWDKVPGRGRGTVIHKSGDLHRAFLPC